MVDIPSLVNGDSGVESETKTSATIVSSVGGDGLAGGVIVRSL